MKKQLIGLGVAALIFGGVGSAGAATIYWSDFQAGDIFSANLDGSDKNRVIDTVSGTTGIAIDETNQLLYWSGGADGQIYNSNLDGSNAALVADTGANVVWHIGLSSDAVFFNSSGITGSRGLGKVDTDGMNLSFIGEDINGEGLVTDPDNQEVYYQAFSSGWPLKVFSNSGGGTSTVIDSSAGYINFIPGIALDPVQSHIYFTDANASGNKIMRVNYDGSNLTSIANVAYGTGRIYDLEVDYFNELIYYGNSDGTIGSVRFDGSQDSFLFDTGASYLYDMDIVFDNQPVPEPATMLLFGTGLVGLAGSRLRKKKK